MPGSLTTPGCPSARVGALVHVAFRYGYSVGARDYFPFAARWLACAEELGKDCAQQFEMCECGRPHHRASHPDKTRLIEFGRFAAVFPCAVARQADRSRGNTLRAKGKPCLKQPSRR